MDEPTANVICTSTRPAAIDASARSIAGGLALFCFLLIAKLSLFLWEIWHGHANPLGDVPASHRWMIAGYDAVICLAAALPYFALIRLARHSGRLRWVLETGVPALLYLAIIVFTVASLEVTRVYGEPLDIEKLRSADNLMVMRGSLAAYLTPLALSLLGVGAMMPLISVRPIAAWLIRRRWPATPAGWWAVMFVSAGVLCATEAFYLRGIDTMGVKDNAFFFFAKSYRRQTRQADLPALEAQLEQRLAGHEQAIFAPTPSGSSVTIVRDFPWEAASARGMNVVLIQMESTSAPHLDARTAPNITSLAQHGLSFASHTTSFTYTTRSSYSIYYSDYMPRLDNDPSQIYAHPMPQPALAEVMKAAGYQTALFSSSFLDYADLRYLFTNKGFDTVLGAREIVSSGGPLFKSGGVSELQTVQHITAWIKQHENEKFLATYMTLSPHHPYDYPPEDEIYPGSSWFDRYRNSLHFADRAVGQLIEFLRAENLLDKTLVVVFGDHGETVSTYPVGHGLNVSGEELFTPFIISNPLLFPGPMTSQVASNHLDIAPVIVSALGVPAPRQWLGRDLLAEQIIARPQFMTIFHVHKLGIRDGRLLYVWDEAKNSTEMFDLDGYRVEPLAASDPRRHLTEAFHTQGELFESWNLQHHVKRALDLQHGPASPELLHDLPVTSSAAAPAEGG